MCIPHSLTCEKLALVQLMYWCHQVLSHYMKRLTQIYLCHQMAYTVYPKKYAHGFVMLRFVVVMQSFIMNSHEVFIHIHQGCFAGTGAIVRLPQCQWSKPDGYGKISQCITITKHSKAKTVCIFLGIYCMPQWIIPDTKVWEAHVGLTWSWQDPYWANVRPMKFADGDVNPSCQKF